MRLILALALLAIMIAPAMADKLILNDGRELDGYVSFQGEKVILLNRVFEMSFDRSQIAKHIECPTLEDLYRDKYLATDFQNTDNIYTLLVWAENNNMGNLIEKHLCIRMLQADPENVKAHEKMKHIRHNLEWYTENEYTRITGLVKAEGAWVTPDDATALQGDRVTEEETEKEQARMRELFELAGSKDIEIRSIALSTIESEFESQYPGITLLARKTAQHQKRHREVAEHMKKMRRAAGLQGGGTAGGMTDLPPDVGMVMLGGTTTATDTRTKSGVPFLSNIPGISPLFSRKSKSHSYGSTNIYARAKIIDLNEARIRQQGR